MTAVKPLDRCAVSVTATDSGAWQVVSVPTGFNGITAADFAEGDYLAGFVRHEDGEQFEVYDMDGGDNSGLLQVTSISGTVILARPAIPYASSKPDGTRMTAGTGTHTLTLCEGAGTAKRQHRELNPFWKTFTAADSTPSVADYRLFKTNGTTAITRFDDLVNGQRFVVRRGSADIVITHDGTNIDLFGGVNLTLTTVNPVVEFVVDAGVAKQIDGKKGFSTAVFTSGDATPSVGNNDVLTTAGTTNITDFDDGYEGQEITILRGASDIVIEHDAAKINLGGANITLTVKLPRLTLKSVSGVWLLQSIGYVPVANAINSGETQIAPSQAAVYTALGLKADANLIGANSGIAPLDGSGKVPSANLPSYVDDVVEYANLAAFPGTGATGIVYVALDTNNVYRWTGSAYVEISQGVQLGTSSSTAFRGDYGQAAYDAITGRLGSLAPQISDWNSATANGFYWASNTASNAPPDANFMLGHVQVGFSADWVTQYLHAYTSDTSTASKRYKRQRNNGTWTSWVSVAETDDEILAVAKKLNSVLYYGADPTGATDSAAAFSSAAQGVPAAYTNPYDQAAFGIPIPYGVKVYVPAGNYRLDSQVITNGRAVTWVLESGVQFFNSSGVASFNIQNYLGGRVISHNGRVNFTGTSGIRDQACGSAIMVGDSNNFGGAGIAGFAGMSDFVYYTGRELGGQYVELREHQLIADKSDTTFTTTGTGKRVTFATPLSAGKAARLIIGMIIDSPDGATGLGGSERWSGIITSFDSAGAWIEVSDWYKTNHGSLATGTPTNGTRLYINPCTKIFAQNVNAILAAPNHDGAGSPVFLAYNNNTYFPTTGASGVVYFNVAAQTYHVWNGSAYVSASAAQIPYYTKQAAAVEFAVISDLGAMTDMDGESVYAWGVDVGFNDRTFANSGALGANPGGGKGSRGFSARAGGLGGWQAGFYADGGNNMYTGFNARNSNIGYRYQGADTNYALLGIDGSANQTLLLINNGSAKFGNSVLATGGGITWDFNTSAASPGDVRFFFAGGNSTHGRGQLTIDADIINFNVNTRISPSTTNLTALGDASHAFKDLFIQNAATVTSDIKKKRDIEVVDAALAEAFVMAIEAKSYRMKDVSKPEVTAKKTITRQVTKKVIEKVTVEEFEIIDGKAIVRSVEKEVEKDEPVWNDYPVFDVDGNPVWDQVLLRKTGMMVQKVHRGEPVMETIEEDEVIAPAIDQTYTRRHYGFIAQDFEAFLAAQNISSVDFAGLIIDGDDYALRYEECLVLMWPVLQKLVERVRALEGGAQ